MLQGFTNVEDMEQFDDSVNAAPEARIVINGGNIELLDGNDTAVTKKNETLSELVDSDIEVKSTPTPNRRKKAYACSRCGKPMKGHKCNATRVSLPTYFLTQGKRRRTTKRRFSIEGEELNVDLHSATTTETKKFTTGNFSEIHESLRDTEKDLKIDQSRNWYDDDHDHDLKDDPTKINQRSITKKRDIPFERTSEDDDHDHKVNDAAAPSQTSFKRSYTCRLCGLPRKGHICQYVSSNRLRQPPQLLSPTPPKRENIDQRRRRDRFEHVSVMEQSEYNSGNDSCDDDDDDDEDNKNRVPATEILIPAQMLLDEIHAYIRHQVHQRQDDEEKQPRTDARKVAEIEKQCLQTWATNVSKKFESLNVRAYNEIQRSCQQKQIEQSITKERDMIMTLRNKIRCIQNDNRTIADHVVSLRNEHNRNIAASQFLAGIDEIRTRNSE